MPPKNNTNKCNHTKCYSIKWNFSLRRFDLDWTVTKYLVRLLRNIDDAYSGDNAVNVACIEMYPVLPRCHIIQSIFSTHFISLFHSLLLPYTLCSLSWLMHSLNISFSRFSFIFLTTADLQLCLRNKWNSDMVASNMHQITEVKLIFQMHFRFYAAIVFDSLHWNIASV